MAGDGGKGLFKGRGMRKLLRNRLALASIAFISVYAAVALASFVGLISLSDTTSRALPDRVPGVLEGVGVERRAEQAVWFIERFTLTVERAVEAGSKGGSEGGQNVLADAALAERRMADGSIEELEQLAAEGDTALKSLLAVLNTYDEFKNLPSENRQKIAGFQERITNQEAAIVEVKAELEAAQAAGDAEAIEDAEKELAREEARLERLSRVLGGRIESLEEEIAGAEAGVMAAREAYEAELIKTEEVVERLWPMPTGAGGLMYEIRGLLGSDSQGRSIMLKALYSTRIAFQIGFVVAIAAVIVGTLLGAAAGFYGGWVDYIVMYVVSMLSSVPSLVLLGVLVYMFQGSEWFDNPAERPGLALVPVYAAMGMTFWVSTCRVIRGEVMKIKSLEYVQAATAIGFGRLYVLFRHVIPNTAHLMFINFALLFIGAIKSEVILSFLGLGVKGQPSWGIMISQGKDDVATLFFWEVGAASVFMFGLVLAFNILTDALQDAFDPRHVG